MTLGEIKIESLRLLFAGNLGYGLNENGLNALLSDDNYNVYLYAMTGAINRCFADLESKGATPIESMVLRRDHLTDGVFDLTKIKEYSALLVEVLGLFMIFLKIILILLISFSTSSTNGLMSLYSSISITF